MPMICQRCGTRVSLNFLDVTQEIEIQTDHYRMRCDFENAADSDSAMFDEGAGSQFRHGLA